MTRRLLAWLRPLAAALILAVLVWRLGTGAFVSGLRMINPASIPIALGIGLLTTVFSAWRWCLVARNLGLPLSLGAAVSDYYRALLLNAVLPAGVLGDVHRAVSHGQQSGDVGRGVRAVVLERFAGQIVLLAVGVVVLLSRPGLIAAVVPARGAIIVLGAVVAVVVITAVVVALIARTRRGRTLGRRVAATALADGRLGLLSRETLPAVVVSSAATVAGHVAMFLVAAHVAGVSAPLSELVPIVVLALIVMGLPVNIGGWGPREGFLALAFGAVGLGSAQGVTVAVVYGVLTLVASLPGAALLFQRRIQELASKIVRYRAKAVTRPASSAFPFWADAREGRPITPESVYAAMPTVRRSRRSSATVSAAS
jgi:uncharacterized membrane protein YbhN (UPF0104 family)